MENTKPVIQTETLIRYLEIWVPTGDGNQLILQDWRTVDGDRCGDPKVVAVRPGEGLAGAAWKQKSATILQEDPSILLRQLSAECGAELSAVVTIPVFRQQQIRGVVVLGISSAYGAMEVWSRDERDERDELTVTSGYYSGLPSFEFITKYTRFPKGAGVPGNVWKSGEARFVQNLNSNAAFIRSFGNDPAKISSVIGLPVATVGGFPSSILLLLTAVDVPLATRTEFWQCQSEASPDSDDVTTKIANASVAGIDDMTVEAFADWQVATMQKLSDTLCPILSNGSDGELPDGAQFHVAVPIFRQSEIKCVLNLLF